MLSEKRAEFLKDILITAVEGGINYWAEVRKYQPDNCSASVIDTEDEFKVYNVSAKTIQHGLSVMRKSANLYQCYWYKDALTADHTNGENGDIDAEVADVILQLGLFDDIIYG